MGNERANRRCQCRDPIVKTRVGMGVEPTAASSALPATGVEDQGAHRDTCQPTDIIGASRHRLGRIGTGRTVAISLI